MAITSLDELIAGFRPLVFFHKNTTVVPVVGRFQSTWDVGGIPPAGVSSAAGVNGEVLSQSSALVQGALRHYDPASGNAYLARFMAGNSNGGRVLLLDRLWHNNGLVVTSTSPQAISTPTWPARCPTSGTDDTPSTNGHGVQVALEFAGTMGAGTPTVTLSYTNEQGTAGRTGTNILAIAASGTQGGFYPISLQGSDQGVRSIQSVTFSASFLSGTVRLVAYRHLAAVEAAGGGASGAIDPISGGLPRLYNGCTPFLVYVPTAASSPYIQTGGIVEAHG